MRVASLLSRVGLCIFLCFSAACGEEGGEIQILSLEPNHGTIQTELPVAIGGQNFRTDIGYTVFFGNKRAGSVTIANSETLILKTPVFEEPGVVDVTIRADNGDAFRIRNAFTFEPRPGQGSAPAAEGGNLAY